MCGPESKCPQTLSASILICESSLGTVSHAFLCLIYGHTRMLKQPPLTLTQGSKEEAHSGVL